MKRGVEFTKQEDAGGSDSSENSQLDTMLNALGFALIFFAFLVAPVMLQDAGLPTEMRTVRFEVILSDDGDRAAGGTAQGGEQEGDIATPLYALDVRLRVDGMTMEFDRSSGDRVHVGVRDGRTVVVTLRGDFSSGDTIQVYLRRVQRDLSDGEVKIVPDTVDVQVEVVGGSAVPPSTIQLNTTNDFVLETSLETLVKGVSDFHPVANEQPSPPRIRVAVRPTALDGLEFLDKSDLDFVCDPPDGGAYPDPLRSITLLLGGETDAICSAVQLFGGRGGFGRQDDFESSGQITLHGRSRDADGVSAAIQIDGDGMPFLYGELKRMVEDTFKHGENQNQLLYFVGAVETRPDVRRLDGSPENASAIHQFLTQIIAAEARGPLVRVRGADFDGVFVAGPTTAIDDSFGLLAVDTPDGVTLHSLEGTILLPELFAQHRLIDMRPLALSGHTAVLAVDSRRTGPRANGNNETIQPVVEHMVALGSQSGAVDIVLQLHEGGQQPVRSIRVKGRRLRFRDQPPMRWVWSEEGSLPLLGDAGRWLSPEYMFAISARDYNKALSADHTDWEPWSRKGIGSRQSPLMWLDVDSTIQHVTDESESGDNGE